MSLLVRIFLSFWLAMLLLALSFYMLQRHYGGEAVEEAKKVLEAQAETAALLWQEGGGDTLHDWIRRQPQKHRLMLIDAHGNPMIHRRLARQLKDWLPDHIQPGVTRIRNRHLLIAASLPNVSPQLYLVTQIDPGRLHRVPIWLRTLMAVLTSGLVSLLLARQLTRQVNPLRQAAQRMAEGDLGVRIALNGKDEISALGADFNLMAERLQDLLQSQRQLVRDVSHELRSPLARLRVALELAERTQDKKKALERIEKEADELEQLVTGLLSLARMESGQANMEQQQIQLDELIAKIVTDADFEAQAQEKRVLYSSEPIHVKGDAVLLRAAVENAIRNAICHTPTGTSIQVSLVQEHQQAIIRVRDAGPGVQATQLELIFAPFARTAESRERSSGGFGLGLSIAQRAMQIHAGNASARNHPEGGLEVRLSLPLS